MVQADAPAKHLWRNPLPLVLASKSQARRDLLTATGLPFECLDASIDERAVEDPLRRQGGQAADIAAHLARAKALAIGARRPDHLVIGADQVLSLEGALFSKPRDLDEAADHLARFSGKTHELHAALCVTRGGRVLFEGVPVARMRMRVLSPVFIKAYIEAAGTNALSSVGAYQLEHLGVHLFEEIEGDQSTILGLPLIPLLAFLRDEGSLLG
ncbi:Maf family protein [Beijerinckia indica]|uniref:Nucleoside triphosphate pyrophosphatase n=1 Tax=Beijerinckia indica subsp. indica (strain ATCC 9039 / DSM 1715 / NCIMB 8712) TaxID=395963 RepID=B2IG54_BEII9|nr:Maf family protein [Beijerinckia indica]ACB97128.1 Maf family protein [Beijerinckia indica subsp. indica ATCC 9039]